MFFFDFADIILENGIGPIILMFIQYFFNPTVSPSIDLCAFFLMAGSDINLHSMDPYTVVFYNPILDGAFQATISHNLHHLLNIGHYVSFSKLIEPQTLNPHKHTEESI